MGALGSGILRGEVKGDHLGAASGNLGLNDSGKLAVLVKLLVVHIQVELAAEAVSAVVLDGNMALLG